MSPPKNKRLKIGDWVTIHARVVFDHENNKRVMKKAPATFDGQIVGGTTKQLGKIEGGSYSFDSYGNEDGGGSYLSIEKTVFVWLVRRGMTNKDTFVLPEDLTCHKNYDGELPWKWTNSCPWPETARKAMSENVKNAPRNKKGQFIKGLPLQKTEIS